MFDKAEITVRAGDGGNGAISFRREKYVPFGGPDGGDGGNGGDVVVSAEGGVTGLRTFSRKRSFKAVAGEHGMGQKKHGRNGKELVLSVPVGTLVWGKRRGSGEALIADLERPGQRVVVAHGGRGGSGNTHFASSTNQAPRLAQKGEAGEEDDIALELRLIADVGIIGYPNSGKSTLLVAASAARPKIASYPFTTLEPMLGVVEVGLQDFVMADIPGLIDDAHLGRGLGHDFLRHIMRTRILIHLIDGGSASPVDDMKQINKELSLFDPTLSRKPQLTVVNKIDLPQVLNQINEVKDVFGNAGTHVLFASAATGEGVPELMVEALKLLRQVRTEPEVSEEIAQTVFRPQPRRGVPGVHKDGDIFVVEAPELERIVSQVDILNPEVRQQLRGQLARLGVAKALERAGIVPGDKVRCGEREWEW